MTPCNCCSAMQDIYAPRSARRRAVMAEPHHATEMARKFGALTLAIVNDENSPVAKASELVLPIGAGPEHAVAATKTAALSMIAGAQLVAALARDDDLSDGLKALPQRLADALAC